MSDRPRVVVVLNSERSGPGRLLDWLVEEEIDADLVAGADLPEQSAAGSAAVDGLVLLGGAMMPNDDERAPFLRHERALVGEALADAQQLLRHTVALHDHDDGRMAGGTRRRLREKERCGQITGHWEPPQSRSTVTHECSRDERRMASRTA